MLSKKILIYIKPWLTNTVSVFPNFVKNVAWSTYVTTAPRFYFASLLVTQVATYTLLKVTPGRNPASLNLFCKLLISSVSHDLTMPVFLSVENKGWDSGAMCTKATKCYKFKWSRLKLIVFRSWISFS